MGRFGFGVDSDSGSGCGSGIYGFLRLWRKLARLTCIEKDRSMRDIVFMQPAASFRHGKANENLKSRPPMHAHHYV